MDEIQIVPRELLNKIINNGNPEGWFLSRGKREGRQRGKFIAVDIHNGHSWVEEFDKLQIAEDWLKEKIEIGG